jgi:hypothetical protein
MPRCTEWLSEQVSLCSGLNEAGTEYKFAWINTAVIYFLKKNMKHYNKIHAGASTEFLRSKHKHFSCTWLLELFNTMFSLCGLSLSAAECPDYARAAQAWAIFRAVLSSLPVSHTLQGGPGSGGGRPPSLARIQITTRVWPRVQTIYWTLVSHTLLTIG